MPSLLVRFSLFAALVAAPALHAQSLSHEIALEQLRGDLARALVRIELLERALLASPRPTAAALPAPTPAAQRSKRLTPSRVDPSADYTPPTPRRLYEAPASSVYIRGPRGGCYTYSASGRKRYVDRSRC